ncbi:hypothetical protein AEQU2_01320 [Aequorivita lipolytica]|nr:hypothetical protein AEQU2_01320 [Aequorivita lipolytica]
MLVALPFFISCKDKDAAEEIVPATSQEATLEQKKQALQNVAPTSTSTANSTKTAGGINPAHGEPGHRCDIPVGAPLNPAAGSNDATPTTNKVNAVPAAISGNGANPPHGQPGHRCDIKVGDPL